MGSPFNTDFEPSKLILEVGKSYLDHIASHVIIESIIGSDDPLYFQGYRFLDNRGNAYSSTGRREPHRETMSDLVREAVTIGYGDTGAYPSAVENVRPTKLPSTCVHGEENCIQVINKDFTLYLEAYPDMEMVRLNIPKDHSALDIEINIEGYPPITIDVSQFLKK